MKNWTVAALVLVAAVCVLALPTNAVAQTGAIFTTVADGSEVNWNVYPSKDAVYLDGGPGIGAPQTAAGLDDGTYVFQITDPSGKTLLSTDKAKCRQFNVLNGIITGVVVTGCEHVTGLDVDHGATTVQMMPYNDTPNPGGEYKAWVTLVGDYLAGCANLHVSNGLEVVDCGGPRGGDFHGFVGSNSKTDNFKVKGLNREIDTYFTDRTTGNPIDGLIVPHIDSLGVTNNKFTYTNTAIGLFHGAHVEDVENGTHYIVLEDQPGCKVGYFTLLTYNANTYEFNGAQKVAINIDRYFTGGTMRLDVRCN